MRVRSRWVGAGAAVCVLVTSACVPVGPAEDGPPTVLMRPAGTDGFFSMPWPSETRKFASGRLNLDGFPGVAPNLLSGDPLPPIPILAGSVDKIAGAVTDYGTNSAIYLAATDDLDPSSLPSPSESTGTNSPIQVVDLETGERAPVVIDVQRGDRFRPDHLVTLLPYPGHPLHPATRYGVVVTSAVRAASGEPLSPAPVIDELDGDRNGPGARAWTMLRSERDELRRVLESSTPFGADDLVAFTVFRTQDTGAEMDAVAKSVAADRPTVELSPARKCDEADPVEPSVESGAVMFSGRISLPRFQTGDYPYLLDGGRIAIGEDGAAIVRGRSWVPLCVKVPAGSPPPGGWPIMTFIDGTGAGAAPMKVPASSTAGWIVASIPPAFGRGRELPAMTNQLLRAIGYGDANAGELLFYNFLNPTAARTAPIQQAGENLALLQAVERLTFDGAPLGAPGPVETDDSIEVISGQSQGAQTLPLVAAVDPAIDGVFSSGGSGGQYHTLVHLAQRRQSLGLFTGSPEALDELNPLVQLVQTVLEAGDGINYANETNYLNVAGYADTCVVVETSRHFASAMGLDTVTYGHPDGFYGDAALDPPTTPGPGTFPPSALGRTRLNVEFPGTHYVAYENPSLGDQFLAGIRAGEPPTIAASDPNPQLSPNCPSWRYDDPPRRFAR